jgi:hypothetical protein
MGEGFGAILPDEMPGGLQIWPFGQGVVVNTVAHCNGMGLFIIAGVPDDLRDDPGAEMEGEPVDIIRALVAMPGNQSCLFAYPTVAAIDATIAQLNTLKLMMESQS